MTIVLLVLVSSSQTHRASSLTSGLGAAFPAAALQKHQLVPELSICGLSDSAMDAAQEARCKEMLDQILVMVTKMVSDLEACNAAFRTAPPAFVADSDSSGREVDATTGTGYNSNNSALATLHSLASASASESKAAARSLADHDPSADRASSYIVVADQDSASVTPCIDRFVLVTELSYIHRTLPELPITTNDSAEQASAPPRGIPFAYGVGRLENRASL
ncbi:uncharacterized protein [Miscanthus floridulus]|uniref:uncharacterized protein n=1 Tax=Miscanthus floridulus TaxID=154761 RepID=UPI00345AA803